MTSNFMNNTKFKNTAWSKISLIHISVTGSWKHGIYEKINKNQTLSMQSTETSYDDTGTILQRQHQQRRWPFVVTLHWQKRPLLRPGSSVIIVLGTLLFRLRASSSVLLFFNGPSHWHMHGQALWNKTTVPITNDSSFWTLLKQVTNNAEAQTDQKHVQPKLGN